MSRRLAGADFQHDVDRGGNYGGTTLVPVLSPSYYSNGADPSNTSKKKSGALPHYRQESIVRALAYVVLFIDRKNLYICRMPTISGRPHQWASRFFESLARPDEWFDLFDRLPGIHLYVKDAESRFVRANQVVCDVVGVAAPGTSWVAPTLIFSHPPSQPSMSPRTDG